VKKRKEKKLEKYGHGKEESEETDTEQKRNNTRKTKQ
jgi:hypothetical protein